MKYIPILSLVIAVTALIHSVSCTMQEVPAYGGYPPPQGQYGRPQGPPMMAQPSHPGAPVPQMHPDSQAPVQQPYGRFNATQTGRNHYNGRLQDGGQVVWTLNGAPVCASRVPQQAKQGFENGLRGRGYQGPIHHMTISNQSGPTGQGSAPFQSPPVDAIPLDDNLETGSDAPAPLPDPVPSNPSFDRTLVRI